MKGIDVREVIILVLLVNFVGIFEWCLWQLTKKKEEPCTPVVIVVPPRPDVPPLHDWDADLERLRSGSWSPSYGLSSWQGSPLSWPRTH
jgi:hypothetical protein